MSVDEVGRESTAQVPRLGIMLNWQHRNEYDTNNALHQSASHRCDTLPEKTALKEKRFILAHNFGDFCPW